MLYTRWMYFLSILYLILLYQFKQIMPKESKGDGSEGEPKTGSNTREYICDCGLKYKSYPAVYTHIKTKHKSQEAAYRAKIKKPLQDNPGVGRPKKTRNLQSAKEEAEIMTVSDNFVIDVFDRFPQKTEGVTKVILDKNDVANKEIRRQKYLSELKVLELQNVTQNKSSLGNKYFKMTAGKFELNLKNQLTKHFKDDLAVKIMIQIDLIENHWKLPLEKISELESKLWEDQPKEINTLVHNCYKEWSQILQKVTLHEIHKQ